MIYKLTIQEPGGTFHGLTYLQSKIITEINKIKTISFMEGVSFNTIHMSNVLFNIMSDSSHFRSNGGWLDPDESVGVLCGMTVYVNLSALKRNQIKLSLTKDQIRDHKISAILDKNGIDRDIESIIEVDSDLI